MKAGVEKAKSKLTPRQSRFVDEYLVDLNATQAAIRAGYSEKTAGRIGPQLLVKTCISKFVQERMNQRSERTEISADMVLQGITRNIFRCEQAAPVLDREGKPVMTTNKDGELAAAYKYDATNVFKGYELLGRHLKLFTDKVDHTTSDGTMSPTKEISGDELDKALEKRGLKLPFEK